MGLMDTLNQCISAGHEMTKAIAIAQFNDDSPEARKITRRWRIGEAADLVGVSSQAIRDAEKAGRLPHPDMETRGRVEQRVGYTSNRSTTCGMCLELGCGVQKTRSLRLSV
ncbi:hypothetical protein [Klebsiella sp. PL-2018]|uniref:hypothetical protein n=1 Tax=Klebsiella sp. PL-2018 TaxID=2851540 RepID=UPI001C740786|nr:hypothetical protein [Klebsiella sp. PL-2018]QXD01406.1 Chromosome (plasmid) partitioning protein ParA [Klebsiella sp. PL-2018]